MQEVRDAIAECISAFANANKTGSLLVLGISKKGVIKGTHHLTDEQRNSITDVSSMLSNQAVRTRSFEVINEAGAQDEIYLIYVPYAKHGICERPGGSAKAWIRQGAQNIPLGLAHREQLRRDKRIISFEMAYCCPYTPEDVDQGVLQEFRRVFLIDSGYTYSDEDLLYQAGALIKDGQGYAFTNAGFLFFASNPQRVLSASYVRLLRFNVSADQMLERGLPTFDKSFGGPITKQIRGIRTFFQESGFFKVYQKRNSGGGFTDEPEYPYIAVDEAIVNAVAHRDYAMTVPVEYEAYRDALVVRNAGRILQRDHDVPPHFSLQDTVLVSTPRNPKLIEWLKLMRDSRGASFVQALSEGTKRMRDEMAKLNLPAPVYEISETQTTLTLFSNADAREALLQAASTLPSTEFANLFPLTFMLDSNQPPRPEYLSERFHDVRSSLRDALAANGWYIDNFGFSRLIAHRRGSDINLPAEVARSVRFYPAYSFQMRQYWGVYYLCIDYTLEVKNVLTLQALLANFGVNDLLGKTAVAQWNGWHRGKVVAADQEWTRVYFFDFEQEVQVPSSQVIPNMPRGLLEKLLQQMGIRFDLHRAIKQFSLALEPNAARTRAEKTQAAALDLAHTIFPLRMGDLLINLQTVPVALSRQRTGGTAFQLHNLPEPNVEFNRHHETQDIREGITKFGSYSSSIRTIELVPICTPDLREPMITLIERLKTGKYKYRGSERTFSTRFIYNSIITTPAPERTLQECRRLLGEHPDWMGNDQLSRIFLVYTPERGYASDDEAAPYYQIKRFLLEQGIPCQMVDTPTLLDPEWKDLNLALNLTAKCGVTPWVLPDAIPDADFFVGLSYTQNARRGSDRLLGYANVFNQYGRWEFYSGTTETFAYEERLAHFQTLVQQTLSRLTLSESPSIYFHYSAKFSKEDRKAILEAARSVRPRGTYAFVWINTDHSVRLYDSRPETDGSLSRGSYVVASPRQIYLSTTGYNSYRRVLGTPQMLELNIWTEPPAQITRPPADLRALAVQILSLTKLNWASTDSLNADPITTKYAHDIAYLTAAFLRQSASFHLHAVLERTPWFI
jgi:predicted HTH transcriptional regulator